MQVACLGRIFGHGHAHAGQHDLAVWVQRPLYCHLQCVTPLSTMLIGSQEKEMTLAGRSRVLSGTVGVSSCLAPDTTDPMYCV